MSTVEIINISVRPVKQILICTPCQKEMEFNGDVLASNPPQYVHVCPNCGAMHRARARKFPDIVYEEIIKITPRTAQEHFDYVVSKLAEQRRPSIRRGLGCAYRADDGSRCAVGWVIPDEMYDERMEDMPVDKLMDEFDDVREILTLSDQPEESANFWERMQYAHDRKAAEAWPSEWGDIATTFGLDYNGPTKLEGLPEIDPWDEDGE